MELLIDYVELVLPAEDTPDDGDVLDDQREGDDEQRAADAEEEPQDAEAVHGEGLEDPEDVHVQVHALDEREQGVHGGGAGQREEGGQQHLGGDERQHHPRVAGHAQQPLGAQRHGARVHHQQDALQPALPLLDEVPHREGRLLPHLALDEVERVALVQSAHREVAVLGHRPVRPVVERHLPLRRRQSYDEGPLPAEVGLVEQGKLSPQLSHVVSDSKAVCDCCDPVHDVFIGISDEALTKVVLAIKNEVENSSDGVFSEKCLFIQMYNPVIVIENIHTIF